MLEKIRAREEAIAHENYMRKQLDEKDKQLDEKDKQLKQFPFYIYLILSFILIQIFFYDLRLQYKKSKQGVKND